MPKGENSQHLRTPEYEARRVNSRRANTQAKRAGSQAHNTYKFVEGQKKPCLFCGEEYIPERAQTEGHKGRLYSSEVFCSKECDDNFTLLAIGKLSGTLARKNKPRVQKASAGGQQ